MDVKLVMFKRNGQRKDFPLKNAVTVIGRGEECDLRVPILSVSRRHCELRMSKRHVTVKDLASSNGTYVNNKRVNEATLKPGDRLVVGPIVFTIQVDGKPEQIRPVKTKGQLMAEAGQPGIEAIAGAGADSVSEGTGAPVEELAISMPAEGEQEIDPISALEALAAEKEQEEKKQK